MPRPKPNTIEEYIADFPPATQTILQAIRSIIKKEIPEAEETISYAIPCFKRNGKFVVYFAGFKNHVSMYPAPTTSEEFKEDFKGYKLGKGTIQFPLDKPLPADLIVKITRFLLEENLKRATAKKTTGRTSPNS